MRRLARFQKADEPGWLDQASSLFQWKVENHNWW